ncbi:hypothetical protein JOF56_009033 [Kibdelosporangium banguiense]|uniref:SapB/AmfS family lantipeptide n=1 Tax=Kibdelosporangium banguiense TaxID=1365924 RepID=A0ABS4TWA4_9PSEU|nr:hypothetical protein [Kibdelosporangium banguiense]
MASSLTSSDTLGSSLAGELRLLISSGSCHPADSWW